ncbi:MAG: L-Lysine--8-amino-7-oxononanoate transaminase [Myxococcota bacterium]|nr:L-Lysine--8-amino-7-oxononanoate transaminase [Myxococcota bacterium]
MTNPRTRELIEKDKRHIWHPFTQMADWLKETPLIIERGEGCRLIDTEGNSYLDGVSSLWVTVHGHRVPGIDQAVREQLDRMAHSTFLGLSHPPAIELAERLTAIAPGGLTRVFYSDSGSTAVEIALKMAYQYWRQVEGPDTRRTGFGALGEAYHGDTIGSVSVGGIELFHATYKQLLFNAWRAPPPYCYRCPWGKSFPSCNLHCADEAARLIALRGPEMAAFIIEPLVQGAAGMITQPPGYLSRIAGACASQGVLLICDEVATGFGRTGTMFAVEQEDVRPDLMAVAKGLTGGYLPLAATLASETIFEGFLGSFSSRRTLFHGHSYTANPLACAAANANLELMKSERMIETSPSREAVLAGALEPVSALPHVGEVRRRGFMVGIELVADKSTRAEYPYGARMGHRVTLAARRRGAIIRPLGNVIVLMPPLGMTAEELRELVSITREAIQAVTEAGEFAEIGG